MSSVFSSSCLRGGTTSISPESAQGLCVVDTQLIFVGRRGRRGNRRDGWWREGEEKGGREEGSDGMRGREEVRKAGWGRGQRGSSLDLGEGIGSAHDDVCLS